jgi:MFS family permease
MLKEVGALGFFIIGALFAAGVIQLWSALGNPNQAADGDNSAFLIKASLITGAATAVLGGLYTRSLGNWLFLLVLLTMGPLATTELGTDSWMETLLKGDLPKLAGWVFVLVSVIMTILRFYAGPIVHRFSPIGLLVISAASAIVGLLLLSQAGGYALILMAVIYGIGKTFLWSTTLGMVSEQFPRGGALTLNGVSAVGVLGMGILGAPLMGFMLDKGADADLKSRNPALHQKLASAPRPTMFGESPTRKDAKMADELASVPNDARASVVVVTSEEKAILDDVVRTQNKGAFARQALLPGFMLMCYLGMFAYFKSKGGYKPVALGHGEEGEPGF